MSRNRRVHAWSIAVVCALVFLFSATAEQGVRALAGAVVSGADVVLQDPPPGGRGGQGGGGGQGAAPGRGGQAQAPRPYDQVITAAAKTDDGIFKVHRIGDNLFFEIPKAQIGKDFVWNTAIKKTTIGAGFGGQHVASRVVRFVMKGDRVLLLNMDFSVYADPALPVAMAVEDSNYPGIIRALPVAAYSPGGDPVIDVTLFFSTDQVPEFSVRAAIGAGALDASRTFLERALSFPENINVETTMTFAGGGGGVPAGLGRAGGARAMRGSSGTIVVHQSLMRLPERPLTQRYFDERVGYVTQELVDYGTDEHRSVNKRFIQRFRLEKKDANAAVSEPVKPIVFYIDAATPKAFVPYVRRGVEEWNAAFEAAGFRGAIVAREQPTGDAEWSAEDARYSVIRWVPSAEETSSYVHDPRSGEILAANIEVYPNVQNFSPYAYFVQVGPVDKRAQSLPLPEAIQGELIRYFVAHQVGHTLGLQHNRKAAAAYTVEQIRDPKFVKTNGHTPTIMDESRFNYVAQPEDGIDPVDLIPRVGAYDKFAIRWGYAPVASARTPDAEKPTLDQWAREQDKRPELRFSTEGQANTDPFDSPQAVGSSDPVKATGLGVKNLARVSDMMLKATSTKAGEPWDDLGTVYGRMVTQWSTEMGHVVRLVGGFETQQQHIGQEGMRFKTVPKARQIEAVQFLLNNAFTTPAFMIKPDVLRRIQSGGVVDRVRVAQGAIMTALLQSARLDRMTEQFTLDGAVAYTPLQFLMDMRAGIWSELAKPGTAINLYRRNVQRSYLDNMDLRLNGAPAASAEVRALVKGELKALAAQLKAAASAPGLDGNTRLHLVDSIDEIAISLDPTIPRPAPAAGDPAAGGRGRGGLR